MFLSYTKSEYIYKYIYIYIYIYIYVTFGDIDIEIEKRTFHYSKYQINISSVDIDKIISEKISFSFKYFIDYKDDKK